jgi:hypothetical protein
VIHKSDRWKYINLNPPAPTIRGLVKVYKEGAPIKQIINWKNAPPYKLAKLLARKLKTYIPLPHTFNVKNIVHLMKELTDLLYGRNIKFASLDISNMYCNVPIKEMIATLEKICKTNNIEDKTKQDILKIIQVIVEQNNFRFQDTIYVQNEGLTTGATTSSILSEIYLQYVENTKIAGLLFKRNITSDTSMTFL